MTLQMLVPVSTYPDGNAEGIAAHAATLGRHLQAEVHVLTLTAVFPSTRSALGNLLLDVPAMVREVEAKCWQRGAAIVQAIEREVGGAGVTLRSDEIRCNPPLFGSAVAERARYFDFTLVGIGGDEESSRPLAEAVIFGSGRPTLLVPEMNAPTTLDHVMIAWDGSRVAARAVHDSFEFLRRAKTVSIATVLGEKSLPDGLAERLSDYLAQHDIRAKIAPVQNAGRPMAETLQSKAAEIGAGLLVMGAFGHSRVRDFVLGGATAGILGDLQVPVLLSH